MSAEKYVSPLEDINPKLKAAVPVAPPVQNSAPVTLISERDSYISELMKSQIQDIANIEVHTKEEVNGIHRLSLPDFFEGQSYDCTRGGSCEIHKWLTKDVLIKEGVTVKRWEQSYHGKYVFRWINSHKLALDTAKNVRGWTFANRTLFPDAPRHLFSISGAVENGDALLAFMSFQKALAIREKPSKLSQEKVALEMNKHESNPNFYKAKLSPETREGSDDAPAGTLQEGRDF